MARGQQQYVVVTKQRKKSGCLGGIFHLFVGLFTFGIWPAMVWVWHLVGPRRKEVSTVYAPTPPAPQPEVRHYIPPSSQPWNQPPTQPQPQHRTQWNEPPQPPPYAPPPSQQAPQPPYQAPPPGQQPPGDPWDTGGMRRRS